MAFDFSKLNFFSKLDARARVLVLFAGLIGFGVMIYVMVALMSSDSATVGPSTAANAPQGLQSVPGAQLNPEFAKAVRQANEQAAKQAQMSGGSAVPTLVNTGLQGSGAGCTVLCGDESVNVKDSLDDWVRQGKVSSAVSTALQELAARNVSVAEYAAMLDQLVREGKLTPEQARLLLEQYTKQRMNKQVQDSAKTLDTFIKSGKLPLDAANALLAAQKKNVTPAEYNALLQEMVRQGKIDADTAARLLSQYMQQRAQEIIMRSITSLRQMVSAGQLTADVEKELEVLEERMVPVEEYAAKLKSFVDAGKLTPVVSQKIIEEFKQQKTDIGNVSSIGYLLQQAEEAAYTELRDLQKEGKITAETAAQIRGMIDKNISYADFTVGINQLVQDKKLTPEISLLKLADYKRVKDLRDLETQLKALQDNNASCAQHEEVLKAAVTGGAITPDEAAQLLKDCQASQVQPTVKIVEGSGDFAQLQQRLEAAPSSQSTTTVGAGDFAQSQMQTAQSAAEARQARIEAMTSAMGGQAGQLLAAWAPPVMLHKEGVPEDIKDKAAKDAATAQAGGAAGGGADSADATGAPTIKAGTILFAVLDTAVNSDYPDSPVMATIVEGKFKGGKMLGKIVITKGVSGQMDRVTLNFTMMNMDAWPKSKTATAYAIDPDTARTVLASEVNYHYMQRFGALMATSFLQGYGQAATSSGGSSTQSAFGTSTQNATLSPSSKMAAAIGQMAQAVGQATKNYTERPPTVIVDSGVGLGILFMTDVT
jgi:type IV secretory pathway VirB10-like protein